VTVLFVTVHVGCRVDVVQGATSWSRATSSYELASSGHGSRWEAPPTPHHCCLEEVAASAGLPTRGFISGGMCC